MLSFQNRSLYWLLAALSLAGYLLMPVIFPLLGHFNRVPLRDIRSFAPSPAAALGYALLFLSLYAVYAVAWRLVTSRGAAVWSIVLLALIFCVPLLFTYPINATDLFRYFVRGRVTAVYGASALSVPPSAFPQDPYLPLAGEWADQTSPYGPVWELLAATVTEISGQNLLSSLLLFKLIAVLSHIGIALLIWRATIGFANEHRAAATLLWAWNPALLFMFVVDGHNDAFMIFWLVLGYVLMRRYVLAGFLVAVLGALSKPIALLALPFLFLAHWRRLESWPARWRYLLAASTGSFILVLAAFAPFGSPLELGMRLLTEASEAVGFSPGVLLVLLAQRLGPPFDVDVAIGAGATLSLALFAVLALLLLWRAWRGMRVLYGIAAALAAYLATAFTFRIWYSTWPFVWLILDGDDNPWALSAAFWFLLTAHLSILIYGHLRVYALGGDQFVAHLIGVPFTFILPMLLARWLPLARLRQS